MGMTVDELVQRMSLDEFVDHWADFLSDPWGEQRADLRSGTIAALIFNSHRGKDQGVKSASDYILYKKPVDEVEVRKKFIKSQKRRR